jgi:hypothetical protein
MAAGELETIVRVIAIGAGVFFGSVAISCVSWVWFKRQIFAYGGSALSVAGIILMGLSIYKTIDVQAAPDGIRLKLAELETSIAGIARTTASSQGPASTQRIEERISQLAKTLAEQGERQNAQIARVETSVRAASMPLVRDTANLQISTPLVRHVGTGDLWSATPYSNYMIALNPLQCAILRKGIVLPEANANEPLSKTGTAIDQCIAEERSKNGESFELSNLLMLKGDFSKKLHKVAEAEDLYQEAIKLRAKTVGTTSRP